MRALVRFVGVALAGVVLYYVGQAHGIVQDDPRPGAPFFIVALVAMSLVLLVWLVSGTGRHDAETIGSRRETCVMRGLSLAATASAFLGVAMLASIVDPQPPDATPYHNDAIALNECSARLLLDGQNPYTSLDIFACYEGLGIGPDRTTPLRRGLFRDIVLYPSDDALQAAWDLRRASPRDNVEFEWRPSYPALSFLALVPWALARLDPNVLSVALLALAMAFIALRTEPSLRGLMTTTLFANLVGIAYTIGGSSDLFWATPLVAAWLWRERRWSAIALGLACAAKQLAWFAAPYYALAIFTASGWREAARRGAIAVGVFAALNLPFVVADPRAWLVSVTTPMAEPMFPLGAGVVFLSTTGAVPLLPQLAYQAMEAAALLGCFAIAWRKRRTSPEVGLVLASLPLFFAWRSLFSYFYLLPLFAAAAVARMPLGELTLERAARLGAVSLASFGPRRLARGRAASLAREGVAPHLLLAGDDPERR